MSTRPPRRPVYPLRRRLAEREERAWLLGFAAGERAEREVRDALDAALAELRPDGEDCA